MIIERPMTEKELDSVQKKYLHYSYLGAIGGVFTSGNIFMLLALALGLSGEFSAAVGTFQYVAYLVLPFGFVLAAKFGTWRSMFFCQLVVILCCILIVLSGCLPAGAKYLFFTGTILIYLVRSAASAMYFPLQKNIFQENKLAAFQQKTVTFSLAVSILGTLLIAYMLKGETSPVKIAMTIIPGIAVLLCSCSLLTKMDEPAILKKMAARPMLKEVRLSFRNSLMRKQLLTGIVLNLFLATVMQVNLVAAKEGLHVSDSQAMLLTIVSCISGIAGSIIFRVLSQKIGPRNTMLWNYPLNWLIPAVWLCIPDGAPWYTAAVPFFLGGIASNIVSMSLGLYFMISIPNRLQIGGTFLIFILTGGLVGILGMVLNPLFFRFARVFADMSGMEGYHYYYLASGIFFFFGFLSILNLPVKYKEYREKKQKKA